MKRLKTVKETKEILKGFSLKAQNVKATRIVKYSFERFKRIILHGENNWVLGNISRFFYFFALIAQVSLMSS